MSFHNNKSKPDIFTHQQGVTFDSEDEGEEYAGSGDDKEEDEEEDEEEQGNSGACKASRAKAIRLNLGDIRDDKDNMKLSIVETIFHAKAHLRKAVMKACGQIVKNWDVNVPQEFVKYNMTGNKLYNTYTKIMNSVAAALRANNGIINFGVTSKGASAEPEYFKVAKKIIAEAMVMEQRKMKAAADKKASSDRMDAIANTQINSALQGKGKRKFFDLADGSGPGASSCSSSSAKPITSSGTTSGNNKSSKPVDPFTRMLELQTRAMELKVEKAEKEAAAIDLTSDADVPQLKRQKTRTNVTREPMDSSTPNFNKDENEEGEMFPSANTGQSTSSSSSSYGRLATVSDVTELRSHIDLQLYHLRQKCESQHEEMMTFLSSLLPLKETVGFETPRDGNRAITMATHGGDVASVTPRTADVTINGTPNIDDGAAISIDVFMPPAHSAPPTKASKKASNKGKKAAAMDDASANK